MKYWGVIPAAGTGSRMEADIPKQYLKIAGKTILEHTLSRFFQHPDITGVVVAIAADDPYWEQLNLSSDQLLIKARGGAERCHSVLSALKALEKVADQKDWVLVHDAARPCLRNEDIDKLISEVSGHEVGGLLAAPVRDTMKRATDNLVTETVDRTGLWHALTPQMFRLSDLKSALENTIQNKLIVTDEAQAMELMNKRPLLIEGHVDNIKITRPQDLALATHYLENMK